MQVIPTILDGLTIGRPRRHHDLTLFPLFTPAAGRAPDYVLLDEALKRGEVEITEVSESGRVPELRFVNRGSKPVLLLDGEELVGAKQNRILNLTVLAPPGETLLPVSCVEAGRWAWREREFRASGRTQFSRGRAAKLARMAQSRVQRRSYDADQGAVWADVAELSMDLCVDSPTSAMADVYDHYAEDVEDYVAALPPQTGQTGALFAVGGRIEGMDLFDEPETLAHSLPKLVRSFAIDAIGWRRRRRNEEVPVRDPVPWPFLNRLASARIEALDTVGLGQELRLLGAGINGAALVHKEAVVHLVAFETLRSGRTRRRGTRIHR